MENPKIMKYNRTVGSVELIRTLQFCLPGEALRGISEAKFISRVKKKSNTKRIVAVILILLLLQFAVIEGLIILNGRSDTETKTDFLIILGAGIKGRTISPSLQSRLDAGLSYLQKYPDVMVAVSGGQGRGEDITEAEAMREFLISNGIDESRILYEPNASSTMENFKFSMALIEQKQGKTVSEVTFVTNSFHVLRAKMLAGRNGLNASAIAGDMWRADPLIYLREYFALIKSFFLDRR